MERTGLGKIAMKFQFDQYVLHARIAPMLITLMPSALLIVGLFPTKIAGMGIIIGAVSYCGMLVLLANLARDFGKKLEPKLYKKWGGAPTSLLLDPDETSLSETELAEVHSKLEVLTNAPYPADIEKKEEVFNIWTSYLRKRTRDPKNHQFRLVQAESINYGFRRNLLGLKWIGIFLCCVSIFTLCFEQYLQVRSVIQEDVWRASAMVSPTAKASLLVIISTLLIFLFVVKASWVKVAGTTYAKRLIECTDLLEGDDQPNVQVNIS
jgi:hypothetical protein